MPGGRALPPASSPLDEPHATATHVVAIKANRDKSRDFGRSMTGERCVALAAIKRQIVTAMGPSSSRESREAVALPDFCEGEREVVPEAPLGIVEIAGDLRSALDRGDDAL